MGTMREAAQEAETELSQPQDSKEEGGKHIKSSAEPTEPVTKATTKPVEGEQDKEVSPPVSPVPDILVELDKLNLDDKLKQELKNGYLRHADYTKKTQEIAAVRKEAEAYKKYQPILDKVLSDQKLLEQVLGLSPENLEPGEEKPPYPEDPVEYAKWVKEQTLQELVRRNAFEHDLQTAARLDERLLGTSEEDVRFQRIIAGLIAQDEGYRAGQKTATQATKEALVQYDEWQKGFRQRVQKEFLDKAKTKSFVTQRTTSPGTTGHARPGNIREAWKEAEEELGTE